MDGVLICVVRMHGFEFIHGWMNVFGNIWGNNQRWAGIWSVHNHHQLRVFETSESKELSVMGIWKFQNKRLSSIPWNPERTVGFHGKKLNIFGAIIWVFGKMKTWDYYYIRGIGYLISQCSPLYIRNGYLIFWEPWLSILNFKTDTRLGFGAVSNKHPTLETTQ